MKLLLYSYITLLIGIVAVNFVTSVNAKLDSNIKKRYKPDWNDLDTRPLPQWYDEAKVGIFLHWGVYSVPGFGSEWFWAYWLGGNKQYVEFMKENYPPGFTYPEFASMFNAEFFDPDAWAKLFAKSGAKYIVLTSKHHDGYALFPSRKSFNWNSLEIGPNRDLVGDLSKAVRKQGLKFGVYHSLYEWYNPIYREDKKSNFSSKNYVFHKLWPDLKQLVTEYKPSVIWADGDWEAHDTYWNSKEFLAWLYNDSPVKNEVVVNDRWGIGIPGKHGDFYNFADRFNNRTLQTHKWENAFTVDSISWGYRRNMDISHVSTALNLITELVTTVSCGGNVLINVGPTKEGTISPIFQDRLLSLGKWLAINGEAIYNTSPWLHQNDTTNGNVWYTCTKCNKTSAQKRIVNPVPNGITLYAITLEWPKNNLLKLHDVSPYLRTGNFQVELLGNEGTYLNWIIVNGLAQILLPEKSIVKSENAWTLKFSMK